MEPTPDHQFDVKEFEDLVKKMTKLVMNNEDIKEFDLKSLDNLSEEFCSSLGIEENSDNSELSNERLALLAFLNLSRIYKRDLMFISESFGVNFTFGGARIVEEIANELNLDPKQPLNQQIKDMLSSHNGKDESNQDIDALVDKVKSLKAENKKLKSAKHNKQDSEDVDELSLTLQTVRKEKSKLEEDLIKLKMEMEKLKNNNEELKFENESIKSNLEASQNQDQSADDTSNLNKSVNLIGDFIEDIQAQLSALTQQKRRLSHCCDQQQQIITILENECTKKNKEVEQLSQLIKMKDNSTFLDDPDELFDSIAEIVASSSLVADDIIDVTSNSSLSVSERIISIVSILIKAIQNQASILSNTKTDQGSNLTKKLVSAINAELSFIERLAASNQDREFLKPEEESDDASFRRLLLQHASQIKLFLENEGNGLLEDADIFDALSLNEDPTQLESNLKRYLDTFPSCRTDEGEELLALLRQSFAAFSILRRYAIEAKNHIANQANEIKKLLVRVKEADEEALESSQVLARNDDNEIDQLKEENEQLKEELQTERENSKAATELITSTINILKTSLINREYDLQAIITAIQQCHEYDEVDDEKYLDEIQYLIANLTNQFEAANNKSELSRSNSPTELSKMSPISYERRFSDKDLKDVQMELEDKEAQIQQLNFNIAQLTKSLNDLDKPQSSDDSLLQAELSYAAGNEKYRKRMEKKVTKAVIAAQLQEKEKRDLLKARYRKLRAEKQALIDQLKEKDEQIKLREEAQDQLIDELRKTIAKYRQNELNHQKEIAQLKSKKNELTIKLSYSTVENTTLQQKIKAYQEHEERNKIDTKSISTAIESQYKVKFEESLQECKNQADKAHHDFIVNLCNEFRNLFDVSVSSQSLNDEAVINLVRDASKKYTALSSNRRNTSKQLKDLQKLFNAPSSSEVLKAAQSFVSDKNSEIDNLRNKLDHKNSPRASGKEWENWAKTVYQTIHPGQNPILSTANLRKNLEEALFEAAGITFKLTPSNNSLRIQKALLTSFKSEVFNRNPRKSLRLYPIISLLCFIRRTQKLSGNLPSNLSFSTSHANASVAINQAEDNSETNIDNDDESDIELPAEAHHYEEEELADEENKAEEDD